MKKRGFVIGWQNRHWAGKYSAYNAGQNNPNIPSGGTGSLPEFMTNYVYGRGYDYYYDSDDDRIQYEAEIAYVSSVFISTSGQAFRFVAMYERDSHTATSFREYFLLAECDSSGRFLSSAGYGDNLWNSVMGASGNSYYAYVINAHALATTLTWGQLSARAPFMNNDVYNMMVSNAEAVYGRVKKASVTSTTGKELFTLRYINDDITKTPPLEWTDPSDDTTVNEIVQRARSLSVYKYWYGGAGQVATKAIADSLKKSYPSIWTNSYYSKALNDIGQRVGDCSYLVNYAYGIASPGNHGPGTSQYLSRWPKWTGAPKDGMIAWRNGHTGIYAGGKTLELVGIDYDYQEKTYNPSKWSAILYDPNRTY